MNGEDVQDVDGPTEIVVCGTVTPDGRTDVNFMTNRHAPRHAQLSWIRAVVLTGARILAIESGLTVEQALDEIKSYDTETQKDSTYQGEPI